MSSAATASSLTASPGSCRGVITRRSSTFHPIKRTLLRVPSHSKNQLHQNWVARRAATVVTRASPRDGEDTEAAPPTSPGFSSSRRNIINGVFFTVSLPLWRDIAHDLGYLHGKEALRAGEEDEPAELPTPPPGSGYKTATFAGGCFWCMEKPFDVVDGVLATTSGYTGGNQAHPTYHEVGAGATGHRESVQVLYDPAKVSYEQLLSVYWKQIDPTADDRMFLDQGMQYSSAIFVDGPEQRRAAEESLRALEVGTHSPASRSPFTFPAPIKTKIIDASTFWPAEKYHQNYYQTTTLRYSFYRSLSGRDEFIQSVWGPEAVYGGGDKV